MVQRKRGIEEWRTQRGAERGREKNIEIRGERSGNQTLVNVRSEVG
jgi:hypothetical protein